MKKNDSLIIEITDITNEAMGVGHAEGMAVFVPKTAPGDVIRAVIVKVKSSYAYARCLEVIKKSEYRVTPPCYVFGTCGGCQLMHIIYNKQLELKKSFIENSLKRIGKIGDLPEIEMIGSDFQTGYRNKMIFPVGKDRNGEIVCGFYAKRSHSIIPVNTCMLGLNDCAPVINALLSYMKECGVEPYNEEEHTGIIRRLFIRYALNSGQTMVVISANARSLKNEDSLTSLILKADPSVTSIILNTNDKRTNLVLGERNRTIYGSDTISDTLCSNEYVISPHSFFQVNPHQTEKLYNKALELADIDKNKYVMDIYCGIGTIALTAAKKAKKVIGVEIVPEAVEDAKINAARNGIENSEFICAQAEDAVPPLIEMGEKPDIVFLDPPRKGSDEKTLAAICSAEPEKIVYVSCNAATLARDVNYIGKFGYRLSKICGVDMFPNTVHVETIMLLQRRDT